MTVQAALKAALRDIVGPAARARGFRGSSPNWRKGNDLGDLAIVNVQTSQYSNGQSLRCVLNLSLAPEPWLAWMASQRPLPKTVGESYGLYRARLHPPGTPADVDGWWEVNHPDDALEVAADMVGQLDETGWPTLERLLDRNALIAQVRAGDLGNTKQEHHQVLFAMACALLLADRGPSAELDDQLAFAREQLTDRQRRMGEAFDSWVRARATTAGG